MLMLSPVGFLGNLGPLELIVIAIIALLIFGPRLPNVMRSIGKGIVEFKKGLRDTGEDVKREIENSERPDSSKQIDHKS